MTLLVVVEFEKKLFERKIVYIFQLSIILCTAPLIDGGNETNISHLDSHSLRFTTLNQFASQSEDDGFYCFLETRLW